MDDNEDIRYDTAISPFASDVYRASIFYQRHVDFACLSVLSVLLVFAQEQPRLQLSLTLGTLVLHTVSVLLGRPYTVEASFNHVVRISANFVAMMGATASFLSFTDNAAGATATATSKTLVSFSYFMLVLCIGLAFLFVASFFFTLVVGAKLDHKRALKRTKAERMLVSPVTVTGETMGGALSPLKQSAGLSEGISAWSTQARDQRVRNIRSAANAIARMETSDKEVLNGERIFVPQIARESNPSDKHYNNWNVQGMECQANPLFVSSGSGSFCPPHSGGHKISDWYKLHSNHIVDPSLFFSIYRYLVLFFFFSIYLVLPLLGF
jgi:hypothetical protein